MPCSMLIEHNKLINHKQKNKQTNKQINKQTGRIQKAYNLHCHVIFISFRLKNHYSLITYILISNFKSNEKQGKSKFSNPSMSL